MASLGVYGNEHHVDPDLHLERMHLPVLERSLGYYRQSDNWDVGIEEIVEGIMTLVEVKGEVNSEDVKTMLMKSAIRPLNVYTSCPITGTADFCDIDIIPLSLYYLALFTGIIVGLGGYFAWDVWDYMGLYDINITVGHTTYTTEHSGSSFGFFGTGYYSFRPDPREPDHLYVNGFALLAFV
jgi:hypothetical protein